MTEPATDEPLNPYAPSAVAREGMTSSSSLEIPARIAVILCGFWLALTAFIVWATLPLGAEIAPPLVVILGFDALIIAPPACALTGAWSMLQRKRYGLCLVGAGCMLVPLLGPCLGCTFPLGIWLLIVLRRPVIQNSFAQVAALPADAWDAEDTFAAAARLDQQGEWEYAIDLYRTAAVRWPERAKYAENCIAAIARKQAAGA